MLKNRLIFVNVLLIVITLLSIGGFAFIITKISTPTTPEKSRAGTVLVPAGWDYNLTKRCVKSVLQNVPTKYLDTPECGTSPRFWGIANESEPALAQSCPGPAGMSFKINDPSSPLTIDWQSHTDESGNPNYKVI